MLGSLFCGHSVVQGFWRTCSKCPGILWHTGNYWRMRKSVTKEWRECQWASESASHSFDVEYSIVTHTTGKEEKTVPFPESGERNRRLWGSCIGNAVVIEQVFMSLGRCFHAGCLRVHVKDRLGLCTVCGSCDFLELPEKLTGTVQIETIHPVNSHERILAIIFFLNKCGR